MRKWRFTPHHQHEKCIKTLSSQPFFIPTFSNFGFYSWCLNKRIFVTVGVTTLLWLLLFFASSGSGRSPSHSFYRIFKNGHSNTFKSHSIWTFADHIQHGLSNGFYRFGITDHPHRSVTRGDPLLFKMSRYGHKHHLEESRKWILFPAFPESSSMEKGCSIPKKMLILKIFPESYQWHQLHLKLQVQLQLQN